MTCGFGHSTYMALQKHKKRCQAALKITDTNQKEISDPAHTIELKK